MKFNIDFSKKAFSSSLNEDHVKNTNTAINQEIFAYQQRVKSINYATIIIRPDVIYAAFKLTEFFINSFQTHINATDRILFYLIHTKNLTIKFDARVTDFQFIFIVSSDVFYADDSVTKYNSHEYGFKLFNEIID